MNVKEYKAFQLAWDALDYCKWLMDTLEKENVTISTDGYKDTVRALEAVTSLIKEAEGGERERLLEQALLDYIEYHRRMSSPNLEPNEDDDVENYRGRIAKQCAEALNYRGGERCLKN